MSVLLQVRDLDAFYGQTQALHGLGFELEDGGITTLLGANGAGKTTSLRAICGMVKVSGTVSYDGQNLIGRATEAVVRQGIAHVPEGRGTFVRISTEEKDRKSVV